MTTTIVSWMRRNLIPLCVFLVSMLMTLLSWHFADQQEQAQKQQDFAQATHAYRQVLERRMEAYVRFLDGLSGLFAVSDSVSSKQFDEYISQAKIVTHYPGTNRIGYLPRVPAAQKEQHEAHMHAAGFMDYRIRANKPTAEYYPYDYLSPMDASVRRQLLGIDPHLQPDRNEAMQRARDTDEIVSTGKLGSLVMPSTESSYIFYDPIYRAGMPRRTVAERRQALIGYVFAAFRADSLIDSTLGKNLNRIAAVRFYDGSTASLHNLLYDSGAANSKNDCTQCITHIEPFQAAGRTWSLEFHARPAFKHSHQGNLPLFVLLWGTIASLLLTVIARERNQKRLLQKQQHEQNQRFRSLFDQNPDAVYASDLNGVLIEANAATAAWAGLPVSDLIGKPFTQFIAPECLEAAKQRFARALNGIPTHAELTIINYEGECIEASVTGIPIMVDGKVSGVFGVAKDITSRKNAELQNLQMRQFLDATLENLPTMLFVKQAGSLRFIAWNRASEELTGIPREEIIGKTDYDLYSKQDADSFVSTDRQVLDRGAAMDIAEEVLQTRHRGVRWLHTRKVPFKMGDTWYLLGISEDITERRQAEEALKQAHAELEDRVRQRTRALRNEIDARKEGERALQESEEKFRSIFEQAPVGIAHIGLDGKWLKTNQKLSEIVGYSVSELAGMTYLDLTHPDDLPQSLAQVKRVIEDNTVNIAYEKRYIRKNGDPVWVNVTRSAIRSENGETLYYLSIVEDITQRKQAEAAMRELTRHLQTAREDERARIAREIHDDLGGVLAAVRFDLSVPVRQEDADQSGLAKRNQSTIKLVDNAIVALRRIMADLRPSILDDLGLWAAIEWQATEFESRTGVQTSYRLKGDEVEVEPNRATALFRMVQEALTNVAKHSQATEVKISATTTTNDIIIRIRDNGRGIMKAEQSKDKSFGIMGMRERARAFGGVVKINGRAGEGTTVSMKLSLSDNK